ncbi:MAG: SRPBCC family protein [Phycisphaerae bacterium]
MNGSDKLEIKRDGAGYRLLATTRIPAPLETVFPFFADAANLEVLTPDFLHFHIVTPQPLEMAVGLNIDYRLRMHGLPMRWRSEITVWEPPYRFMDVQKKGPYRWWRHEHRFIDRGANTIVEDEISYGVPFRMILHPLFIKRDLLTIFNYRLSQMHKILG